MPRANSAGPLHARRVFRDQSQECNKATLKGALDSLQAAPSRTAPAARVPSSRWARWLHLIRHASRRILGTPQISNRPAVVFMISRIARGAPFRPSRAFWHSDFEDTAGGPREVAGAPAPTSGSRCSGEGPTAALRYLYCRNSQGALRQRNMPQQPETNLTACDALRPSRLSHWPRLRAGTRRRPRCPRGPVRRSPGAARRGRARAAAGPGAGTSSRARSSEQGRSCQQSGH